MEDHELSPSVLQVLDACILRTAVSPRRPAPVTGREYSPASGSIVAVETLPYQSVSVAVNPCCTPPSMISAEKWNIPSMRQVHSPPSKWKKVSTSRCVSTVTDDSTCDPSLRVSV